jgi:hypothetical protein
MKVTVTGEAVMAKYFYFLIFGLTAYEKLIE